MIPRQINADHILAAIAEVDAHGIPPGRESSRYVLRHNGRGYPPKYVVSKAARYAIGRELTSDQFNGGYETNSFLRGLGFKIDGDKAQAAPAKPKVGADHTAKTRCRHDERCKDCKVAVRNLLEMLYGTVEVGKRFPVGNTVAAFSASKYSEPLQHIFVALCKARGFSELVRSPGLPACDYFVQNPGFLVEFDESQHFTALRECALSLYPDSLPLGFDRETWMGLCRKIKARDDTPPFRDEQRAWYDTLRDFLPTIASLLPTVRIFASEYSWCKLSPSCEEDVEKFRQMLSGRSHFWKIESQPAKNPRFGRLVMDGMWSGDVNAARAILANVSNAWLSGQHLTCLSTCGAFLRFDWPSGLVRKGNLNPDSTELDVLISAAEATVRKVLTQDVVSSLRQCCDYLTLGVDTKKPKISTTHNVIGQPHAELVCLADLRKGNLHWTGKFYPTPQQERTIVRYPDLKTHFVQLDGASVMLLGCHDLSVYSPRGQAKARGWREELGKEFRSLAKQQSPTIVLHHPHTTVKVGTWRQQWRQLERELPSVSEYLGTGAYSSRDEGWNSRDKLQSILSSTQRGGILNVVVRLAIPDVRASSASDGKP